MPPGLRRLPLTYGSLYFRAGSDLYVMGYGQSKIRRNQDVNSAMEGRLQGILKQFVDSLEIHPNPR